MKILEVLDTFYPSFDGPINVIVNLAKILNQKKLAEVELLVPDNPSNRVEVEGVKIHRSPSINGPEGYQAAVPFLSSKTRKIIKEGGFDLIHVHSPFTLGKFAIEVAKKAKIPTMITIHTKYKDDFERILKTKFMRDFMMKYIMSTINKADYVLSVSNGAADVVKSYGYKGENIYVIRNGTDLVPHDVDPELIAQVKKEYKIKDEFVFLFVGRLVSVKNVQFSLQALSKLKESGVKNFKFLIVGSGDYEDNLRELTEELNLNNEVIFTGKVLDREKLAAIYNSSDLFLFPSTFDTCGIVVIEAAANKLPCVVLKDSCPAEMVKDGVSGFILPLEVEAWVECFKKVVENRGEQAKMKEAALEKIYISWEKVSREYLKFYKDVLGGRVAPSLISAKAKRAQKRKTQKINKSVRQRLKSLKKQLAKEKPKRKPKKK